MEFRKILEEKEEWMIRESDEKLKKDGEWRVWIIMGGRG